MTEPEVGEPIPVPRVKRYVYLDENVIKVFFTDGKEVIATRDEGMRLIRAVDPPRDLP
jgi:hypothetical protein